MTRLKLNYVSSKVILLVITSACLLTQSLAQSGHQKDSISQTIEAAEQINPTTVQLIFTDNHRLTIDFYGENIFRVFEDTSGGIIRKPESSPPANILVDNPRKPVSQLAIKDAANNITISSAKIFIEINKNSYIIFRIVRRI